MNGHFDEWGKVTEDELKLTECSFDKNADAILLLDLGQVFYQKEDPNAFRTGNFLITTSYYQRYKVLTEKGTDEADFKIRYNTTRKEDIFNIKAYCFNMENGQIIKTELKPTDRHTTQLSANVSEIAFSVPGVKKGSVFEVAYSRNQYLSSSLPSWQFTASIPSVKSSVTIGFVDALDYYIDKHILTKNFEEKSTPYYSGIYISPTNESGRVELSGKAVTYTTYNIPAYKEEEYVNSSLNYKTRIGFQLRAVGYPLNFYANTYKDQVNANIINSYAKLNEHIYGNPYFVGNIENEPIPKQLWQPLLNDKMNEEQKTEVIFDFIRSNLTETSHGGFWPESGNNKIWKNKTGSITEINILLINTLKRAGINAYPMLVSERSKGYINMLYPMAGQFQDVVALVEIDNGKKKFVLDASDKYLAFGLAPPELLNTYGLVFNSKTETSWYAIYDQNIDNVNILINAVMDDNAKVTGQISIASNNYTGSMYKMLKATGHENVISERLKKEIPNVTIESYSDTLSGENNRFIQKLKFSAQLVADNDGNVYVSFPSIYGNLTNPFASAERTSDVDFANLQKENIVLTLTIPDDYSIDSITKSIKLIMPDSSITFAYQADNNENKITLVQKSQYYRSFFKRQDYLSLYDFFQKYYDIRQRPVILKKKT